MAYSAQPPKEKFRVTWKYIVRIFLVNSGAALAAPIAMTWAGGGMTKDEFLLNLVISTVYSFVIGTPAALVLPWMADVIAVRTLRWRLVLIGSVCLSLTAIGALLAGQINILAGLQEAALFWPHYWFAVRLGSVLAVTIGCALFAYERLRRELEAKTLELRTRELEEERARKLFAEARLSSLESRIHPHFLFNTLNSISSLIPEDPRRAEEIVGRLAALLRFSLDAGAESLVPLAQEIRIVRDYLEIEKARFGDRLRYSIDVPRELESARVPPLAVQTLVENSVKHAIAPRREGGEVRVYARAAASGIELLVCDTGRGFRLEQAAPGHGIDNLAGRLNVLFGDAAGLSSSTADGRPAVRLVLPLEAAARA